MGCPTKTSESWSSWHWKTAGAPTIIVSRTVRVDTTAPAVLLLGSDPARYSLTVAEAALAERQAELKAATAEIDDHLKQVDDEIVDLLNCLSECLQIVFVSTKAQLRIAHLDENERIHLFPAPGFPAYCPCSGGHPFVLPRVSSFIWQPWMCDIPGPGSRTFSDCHVNRQISRGYLSFSACRG